MQVNYSQSPACSIRQVQNYLNISLNKLNLNTVPCILI
jgi:hypothetical protein